ncbi:MAG: DUF2807 domain-containing protein [Chloroflexi bacterium]|nr:DUF2807 domain-containing protein [Chloroflexota bacterium]
MVDQNSDREVREVAGFTAVLFKAAGKIVLTQGQTEGLEIQADAEVRSRIHHEVKDGVLILTYDADWLDWTGLRLVAGGLAIYHLSMKEIRSLRFSGVGALDAAEINGDTLTLNLVGSGRIKIGSVKVNGLNVDISGVGTVDVAGECADLNVKLDGAGSFRASRLKSNHSKVNLSGVGSATVWAKENLDVTISGVGTVEYYGAPQISQKVSGIGTIKLHGNR